MMHEYKTIWINYNPTYLIKHVRSLNPNSLILFWAYINWIRESCKKLSTITLYGKKYTQIVLRWNQLFVWYII